MSTSHIRQQPQLDVGVGLDVGRSRKDKPNQDSVGLYAHYCQDATTLAVKGLLFVVADGMGGAAGGKEASEMAVQLVNDTYYSDPEPLIETSLERAIQEANKAIHQRGQSDPYLRGLGTTFVALVIRNQELVVGNVGDSRAYLFRQGELWQLSLDHTAVQEQVREGLLTPEEGDVHPRRHVLSRNLGSRPRTQPDFDSKTLVEGDTLLLCSDGLWGPVSDDEITEVLQHQRGAAAAQALVDLANEHGGPDNISVIVVNVDGLAASSAPTIGGMPTMASSLAPAAAIPQQVTAPVAARRSWRLASISAATVALVLIGAFLLRNTLFGGSGQIADSPPAPSVVAESPSSSAAPVAAPATIITSTVTATPEPASTPTPEPTRQPTVEPDTAPLTTRQHGSRIDGLVFTPDGDKLALGSVDTVVLWNVVGTTLVPAAADESPTAQQETPTSTALAASTTAEPVDCGPGSRSHRPLSIAFDADGEAWAATPRGTTIELWQISSGRRLVDPIEHPSPVTSATWSLDGQQLASAAEDGVVIVRRVNAGTFITIATHNSPVCSLAFSSDGQILATGTQDGSLDLWRTSSGDHLETLEQHNGPVAALVFAPNAGPGAQAQDQHLLASAEQDGTLKLWQISGKTFETSANASPRPTTTATGSPASTSVSIPRGSQSPQAQPSAESLEPTRSHVPFLILQHSAPIYSIAFAPDGRALASAGQDDFVKLWQIEDQLLDPRTAESSPASTPGSAASTDTTAAEPSQRFSHSAPAYSIAFAPDGRALASAGQDGIVRLWQIGKTTSEIKQPLKPTATTVGRRTSP